MGSETASVSQRCQAAKQAGAVFLGRVQEVKRRHAEAVAREREAAELVALLEESVRLARLCVEEDQQRLGYASAILTAGLQSVFGPRYEFRLHEVRGKGDELVGVRPQIFDGRAWVSPEFGAGAGVMDVATSLLRIAYVVLWKPSLAGVLWLDEPWVHLGGAMAERMVRFWRETCESAGIQSVIVSHHLTVPEDVAHYDVQRDVDGNSAVERRQ